MERASGGKRNTKIKQAEVGDIISFGSYEQGGVYLDYKKDIEWLVLEKKQDKLLLISRECLESIPYNAEAAKVTWETCSIRKWLNETFVEAAFSEKEKSIISEVAIKNAKNPKFGTKGGKETTDQIFLLSIGQVKKYFPSEEEAAAKLTTYASWNGGYSDDSGNCRWFLRSPGKNKKFAAYVNYNGAINNSGCKVESSEVGIRPAMWINTAD